MLDDCTHPNHRIFVGLWNCARLPPIQDFKGNWYILAVFEVAILLSVLARHRSLVPLRFYGLFHLLLRSGPKFFGYIIQSLGSLCEKYSG
ncbi:MAG: hypothetical protein QS721_06840 [Candidatus Endonucleobacter sp. (ex Gigantidas childressi)]|nr:hypothetical protein [Candidatus Endonucleobacter sp. (ex Gigantidas childressi)]